MFQLTLDLPLPGFLVQPLDITLLAHLDGRVHKTLVELEPRVLVQLAGTLTILYTHRGAGFDKDDNNDDNNEDYNDVNKQDDDEDDNDEEDDDNDGDDDDDDNDDDGNDDNDDNDDDNDDNYDDNNDDNYNHDNDDDKLLQSTVMTMEIISTLRDDNDEDNNVNHAQ
jgi:hypothetical protein